MLFNQDVIAYRAKPAKAYDKFEYYKNGGADEIIFVFHGSGVIESVFGKLPYRAEDYIVIPRGITYQMVPDKIDEEDYLILESVGPVRIPQRYLNHEGQIKMGAPYSERDLHSPSELLTIDKEEDVDVLVKDGPRDRIPQRYLNHEGQIKMGAPYSERDLHSPSELLTIDKEEDVDVLVKDGP